jgi:glycosyltransferase involved in cell wall biosynthesis
LKVLIIHNFHRTGSASGDDQVYNNEARLLEEHGIEVVKYNTSNDVFDNAKLIGKICITLGMIWSFKHYNNVKSIIKKEKPDIVHVHTFFPILSPSILYAAKRCGVKVIATLHDTRFVCPCASSLRGDTICNDCGDGKYFRMCGFRCFKGSKTMSFFVACVFKYHRWRKSFYKQIDRYICLNDTQIDLLKAIGFAEEKIIKKYNFVDNKSQTVKKNGVDITRITSDFPKRYVVYYGRLGVEKGINTLMKTWDNLVDIPLVIIGGGPLEQEVEQWAAHKSNVYYLGYKDHDTCLAFVKKADFVVFPSVWYEGCSMVEIESQMLGKPVVASDIGFSRELIKDGYNGLLFPLKDCNSFAKRVKELWYDNSQILKMGNNAEAEFKNKFDRENNYLQLKKIYEDVLLT